MNQTSSSSGSNDSNVVPIEAEQLAQRLQDLQLLPMANVTRIMCDFLPLNAKIGMTNYAGLLTRYRQEDLVRYLNTHRPNILRPINTGPMPGYGYSYFPPNILFYDSAIAALINARNKATGRNDDGPAESTSSTAAVDDPCGQ